MEDQIQKLRQELDDARFEIESLRQELTQAENDAVEAWCENRSLRSEVEELRIKIEMSEIGF